MGKIIRVGVTFPPELLKDFDEVIAKAGYENRSKAVQDAVRLFVSEHIIHGSYSYTNLDRAMLLFSMH